MKTQPRIFWLPLMLAGLMISSSGLATAQTPPKTDVRIDPITFGPDPDATPANSVIVAIQQEVKQQFGIRKVQFLSARPQMWPDGCLGLPRGKEGCTSAIVPGWSVEVSDGVQTWMYRSDKTGNILRRENADRPVLPPPVANKLIRRVARDTNIFANKLRISEVKTANFDGCLGVYRPQQVCTKILIQGYSVLVTSPDRTYVYNLSNNAGQIAQNDTASGARKAIRVSFDFFGGVPNLGSEPTLVFRSTTSGDLAGRMTRIDLTTDGKVTRYTSAPTIRTAPVVIKTLTPEQLKAFQKVLETQRFRNLNGLSYLTSAALADYPTTGYESPDAAMQFIDLEKASLPRSLQGLIKSWDALVK
jgi:hypothetical protein